MKKEKLKIIVAHGHSSIEVFHSLSLLILLSGESNEFEFKFVDYQLRSLKSLRGDVLILVRRFHKLDIRNDHNIVLMQNELKQFKSIFQK